MNQPMFLIDWLTAQFPQSSRSTLKRMVEQRRVRINGRVANKLKTPLAPSAVVEVGDRPKVERALPLDPLIKVYEDADLLVIDKPAGVLTSSGPRDKRVTAVAIVERYLIAQSRGKARVGLIHRLDRDASGLLVFSKNAEAYESLKSQFFKHTVGRVYDAIVHGRPRVETGSIESLLVESKEGKVFTTRDVSKGQPAKTDYTIVGEVEEWTRLRVTLHTGRKHQIRVHLSSHGHAIVGDSVYGPKPPKLPTLQLRAIELDLDHPTTGKRMSFQVAGLVGTANGETADARR